MEFHNLTPFPALAFEGIDQHDEEFHVIAMRATFDILPESPLIPAEEQPPLVVEDEYFGEINTCSVKQENDLVQYKPKCDVIVIGTAHAPGGTPSSRFEVGITVSGATPLKKTLAIHGPRHWQKIDADWKLTEPEPITSLPLQYEYAYGGQCRIDLRDPGAEHVDSEFHLTPEQRQQHPDGQELAPLAHTAYEQNPVGLGFAEKWYLGATHAAHVQAPQIEAPEDPVVEFGKPYTPQGFGAITKAWLPRRKLGGTADDEFAKSERWLPEDFDFAFWNGAHPDLQIPWLKGGERVELMNLFPAGTAGTSTDKDGNTIFTFTVPEEKPYLFVKFEEGGIVPYDLKIDTIIIDTTNKMAAIVYRTVLWKEPEISGIAAKILNRQDQTTIDGWKENAVKEVANG